jgi:hypothetical protein
VLVVFQSADVDRHAHVHVHAREAWCHGDTLSSVLAQLFFSGLVSWQAEAAVEYVADVIERDLGRDFGSWIFLCFEHEYPCFGLYLVSTVEHCRVFLFFLLFDLCSACTGHSFLATSLAPIFGLLRPGAHIFHNTHCGKRQPFGICFCQAEIIGH